ncbi:MAG: hypothetical protein K1W38_01135 [Lachnospiraceae bacterium]|jgi:hypothetical protein
MLCNNGIGGGDFLDVSVIILFVIYMVMNLLIVYIIQRDRLKLSDSEKRKFGHKPSMKFISKLTCGQVIARMWVDSYGPLNCKFEKDEEDNYIFTINSLIYWRSSIGKAMYKVLVVPEQEGSAVYFIIIDYQARPFVLDEFAWELKRFIEKKLEAVRVE